MEMPLKMWVGPMSASPVCSFKCLDCPESCLRWEGERGNKVDGMIGREGGGSLRRALKMQNEPADPVNGVHQSQPGPD